MRVIARACQRATKWRVSKIQTNNKDLDYHFIDNDIKNGTRENGSKMSLTERR